MLSSFLFPVFKLSRKNTQPENMCDIIFENIEAVVQRCSVKKVFLEISQNSQEKHLCQSLLFWDKSFLNVEAQMFSC